jgi:hypothetical protein
MIRKKVLAHDRIRGTGNGFSFIPHRFLTDGFLQSLSWQELAFYLFLVLASDRNGLSFYGDKTICATLGLTEENYVFARSSLIHKDLVMYDGTLFQVLSLPKSTHSVVGR